MCGMGMGMGSLELNSDLKLSGKELIAMSSVLNNNAEGELDATGLVNELKQMGIDNTEAKNDAKKLFEFDNKINFKVI